MRTCSTRTAVALAFERGEEFDPAEAPAPALLDDLAAAAGAGTIIAEPGSYERDRRRRRERRGTRRSVPDWFSPGDLATRAVPGVRGRLVHGELV
jgi:hypothetical protein